MLKLKIVVLALLLGNAFAAEVKSGAGSGGSVHANGYTAGIGIYAALNAAKSVPGAGQAEPTESAPILTLDPESHTAPIRQIATDASQKVLATVSDDKSARIWELASGRLLATLRPPVGDDAIGRMYAVSISPSGLLALAGTTAKANGGHRIYLFDLASYAFIKAFDALGGDVKRLQWSPDGSVLAASYAGSPAIRVFYPDGRLAYQESLPADAWSIAFSRDGRMAVPVSNKTIRLYSVAPGAVKSDGILDAGQVDPRGVQFSPDGNLLAVGYLSRKDSSEVQVDVFDVKSRSLARSVSFADVPEGNLRNVAWQSDGRALYAGGSGYRGKNSFIVKRIPWPEGQTSEMVVAANSVLDVLTLADGRVAFATAEPGWGIIANGKASTVVAARSAQFYEAGVLRISKDADKVAWQFRPDSARVHFDLAGRRIGEGDGNATLTASRSSWRLAISDWENNFFPKVGGDAVAMQPSEVSRAAAILPDGSGAVLGTSRTLRKFDSNGKQLWSIPLATEVRDVGVSGDSRILVVAMLDGTIRWRRTSDGAMLMSLFAMQDGKWVVWTEQGYYDVSVGAEGLIGWLVKRPGGEQADYFSISRFRDKYFRPDVIDRVLALADAPQALAAANAQRRQQAANAEERVRQRVDQLTMPQPVQKILPPIVTLLSPSAVETADTRLTIDYKLFSQDARPVTSFIVRVDGRPYDAIENRMPASLNGDSAGKLSLVLPKSNVVVQLFAGNDNGISEPATLNFRWNAPPAPAVTPTPTVTPAPAVTPAPTPLAQVPARPAPAAKPAPPAPAPPPVPAPEPVPVDRRPTLYLLAVGVSAYANPKYNLDLAAKDATDFGNAFRKQSGVFYKHVEARLLSDRLATRAAVIEGLEWLKRVTTPDDVGVLFIAGHGVNDVDDTYFFMPHDADADRISKTGVPESQFRDALSNMKGKTLFFVDTCYSGKSVGILSQNDLTRIANKFSSPEYGVIVFSASHGRQESLESAAWGNGAFTKSLVTGLGGAADYRKQGMVTHRGLDYYIGYEVANLTKGMQTPVTMVPTGVADYGLALTQPQTQMGKRGTSK